MKSSVLLAAVAAVGADARAQLSGLLGGGSSNPYQYKAGDALSADYNPMVPFAQTPPWPTNFGTKPIPLGPKPSGCFPFEIIIARGTSEPGAFGAVVGDPVLARVQQEMGNTQVRGYSAPFDGSLVGVSAVTAARDIGNRVGTMGQQCPNMKFAVMGYSVGGAIATFGLDMIPANQRSKVKAVVLYAPFGGAGVSREWQDRTLQNCASGDGVCLNGVNLAAHISYNTKGSKWHSASVKFIVAAFKGQPLPANPGSSWTQSWLRSVPGI